MVAYTDSLGFNKGTGFASSYTQRATVQEIVVDFAKIAAARAAAGAAALTSTDTLVLGTLPKGALVLGGAVTLIRAEGAAGTADFGYTGSLTAFASNFDLNGTVGTTSAGTTPAYMTADTSIVMTVDSASVDVSAVKLSIALVDMGANLGVIPSA